MGRGGSRSFRVVFLGNDPWSVPSLRALAGSDHDVELVVTREPRPAGRGSRPRPTAVADAARELDVPLREVSSVRTNPGLGAIHDASPEVLVVVAYGEILTGELLALPSVGAVNLHLSLLPRLRGGAPVQGALLEGAATTGVTTMLMDEGMDTGPILLQQEETIRPDDDAGSLGDRLAVIGSELLVGTLDAMGSGGLRPRPQAEGEASYAPKLRAEDRWLDWSLPAEELARRVRALSPRPAASTGFRGRVLKVFRARAEAGSGDPGHVAGVSDEGFAVAASPGRLWPLEVAPAGRKRISAAEFVRGYRPAPGEPMT